MFSINVVKLSLVFLTGFCIFLISSFSNSVVSYVLDQNTPPDKSRTSDSFFFRTNNVFIKREINSSNTVVATDAISSDTNFRDPADGSTDNFDLDSKVADDTLVNHHSNPAKSEEQRNALKAKKFEEIENDRQIERAVDSSDNPDVKKIIKNKKAEIQPMEGSGFQPTTDRLSKKQLKTRLKLNFNKYGKLYKAKKYRKAFAGYMNLATKHDNAKAQFNISVMLKLGQGTVQDYSEAYKWCALASLNKLDKATKYLEILSDLLTEKRLMELHREIVENLEEKIYKGSTQHISQLSEWLVKEPFNNEKNKNTALVWELVGSALGARQSEKLRDELADLTPEEMQTIQEQAKQIYLDPKFSKALDSKN